MELCRSGVVVAVFMALALAPGLSAQEQEGLLVTGNVVDATQGTPITQALVQLYRPDGVRAYRETVSNADGRFRLEDVPPAKYRLFVQSLGYRTISEEVEIPNRTPIELRLEMVPAAIEMDPVVITSTSRRSLDREGFFERRRQGLGHTFTRDEVLERSGSRVSDVFFNISGASVIADPATAVNPTGTHRGVQVRFRNGCVPNLILDGIETIPGIPLDDLLDLDNVEALEVYRGSTTPSAFPPTACGTIVAWTRDPGEGGVAFSWTRVAVAAGIVVLSSLLAR